ncbi:MAG: GNAT family N-acetyltransferase [Acidobacteria bacterium]|nr:GNAT family N-acetyltransferase [Acidobacteriota bacterium]
MPFADLELARRLELAEGHAGMSFVDARARLMPATGAASTRIAGACVMFDGPQSPITQTFGLGITQQVSAEEMDRIEAFFAEHAAPVFHEMCPLADHSALALLNERRYFPMEFSSVMFQPVDPSWRDLKPIVPVRLAQPHEADLAARVMTEGWSDVAQLPEMHDLGLVMASRDDSPCFLAEIDGVPAAMGGMFLYEGVALMSGACTIPSARRRGAQRALFEARLRHAAEQGCDLAMVTTGPPGGTSQRNAERQGFRIAYTRIKWQQRVS